MSRVTTERKVNDQIISYEVKEDGYDIYLGETLWLTQYEPYIPNKDLNIIINKLIIQSH